MYIIGCWKDAILAAYATVPDSLWHSKRRKDNESEQIDSDGLGSFDGQLYHKRSLGG